MKATHAWRLAFLGLFLASAYLLLTPRPPELVPSAGPVDWRHALLFAGLGVALARGALVRPLAAWALLLAWGVATEALQALVPGRAPSAGDVLMDAAGALAVFVARPRRG